MLVTNQLGYRHNLHLLDFTPAVLSPNVIFLTVAMLEFMHSEGIEVIPWTVKGTYEGGCRAWSGWYYYRFPESVDEVWEEKQLNGSH